MNAGPAVNRIRSALNFSLAQMAEYTNIPVPTLGAVERGAQTLSDERTRGMMERFKLSEEELEILSAKTLTVPRDLTDESPVYRAVKAQRAAWRALQLPLS